MLNKDFKAVRKVDFKNRDDRTLNPHRAQVDSVGAPRKVKERLGLRSPLIDNGRVKRAAARVKRLWSRRVSVRSRALDDNFAQPRVLQRVSYSGSRGTLNRRLHDRKIFPIRQQHVLENLPRAPLSRVGLEIEPSHIELSAHRLPTLNLFLQPPLHASEEFTTVHSHSVFNDLKWRVPEPLPKRTHLDPRPAHEAQQRPIEGSVNIPLGDLSNRTAELPPKQETISVAAQEPLATQTITQLEATGRKALLSSDWRFGDNPATGRLWEPNSWLAQCLSGLTPQDALDLGCGSGRDAVYLAAHGWRVQAVDILPDAIQLGQDVAARYLGTEAEKRIDWQVADILDSQFKPAKSFDLIFNAFLFDSALITQAKTWLSPNGSFILEAFTTAHQAKHGKPASRQRVAAPGEMAQLLDGLEIVEFEEGDHNGRHTARVWARRNQV